MVLCFITPLSHNCWANASEGGNAGSSVWHSALSLFAVLKTSFNVPRVHLGVAILLSWSGIYCPSCFSLLCAELTDLSHQIFHERDFVSYLAVLRYI